MKTQTNFVFAFLKLILNIFPGAAKLLLMPKVSPSPKIKKTFLILSRWDDELLSTPNIITFLAKSSLKFHKPFPSNAIP